MTRWCRLGASSREMPVFASFFTDHLYRKEAYDLVRSLEPFSLDFDVREVPSAGDWVANTSQKPGFLLALHGEYPDRPLCWVDADARVRRFPSFLASVATPIAYHAWRGRGRPGALSGTVALPPGPRRREVLEAWARTVAACPGKIDQVAMAEAVAQLGVVVTPLPVEYVWIYDLAQEGGEPDPLDPRPVIEHMQASRVSRRLRVT